MYIKKVKRETKRRIKSTRGKKIIKRLVKSKYIHTFVYIGLYM